MPCKKVCFPLPCWAALFSALTLSLSPCPASADEELSPDYAACLKAAANDEAKQTCRQEAFLFWNTALKETVDALNARWTAPEDADRRRMLQKAHRSWLAYRDNMAIFLNRATGNAVEGLKPIDFLIQETRRETLRLRDVLAIHP